MTAPVDAELGATLRAWLAGDDPALAAHAAARLGLAGGRVEPARSPPPLLTRALNFAGAVVDHALDGGRKAGPALVAARLAVCNAPCPERLPGGVCAGCGCKLAWAATWASKDCPRGLWPNAGTEPGPELGQGGG